LLIAIGIDLVEVARIEASVTRFGARFLDRIFTESERRYCGDKANSGERYAARFAAKEAAMKALGTGWSQGVTWLDLEVGREASGKPTLLVHGAAQQRALILGIRHWSVSLTHTPDYAMAQVIAED